MAVKRTRKWAIVGLALMTLVLQTEPGAVARSRYRVRSVRVTKGLHLTRILDRRGAIAATNGTYSLPWGRPIGLFAEDGDLKTSPLMGSVAFSMSRDERAANFAYTTLSMRANVRNTGAKWRIDDWNEPGRPGPWQIAAQTPSAAGFLKPPPRACSARLYPAHKPMWTKDGTGLATDYIVDAARCSKYRMKPRGETVVSADIHGHVASPIRALARKQIIRLNWSVYWRGVMDMIAGSPILLKDSVITASDDCSNYFCDRNPRTGVGMTDDGRLLLVT